MGYPLSKRFQAMWKPVRVEKSAEDIKARYTKLFGV
jgi:hypothetical protein